MRLAAKSDPDYTIASYKPCEMSIQGRPSTVIHDDNDNICELLQMLESEKEKGLQNYRLYLHAATSLKSDISRTQEALQNADKENNTLQQELTELREWKHRELGRQRATTMSKDQTTLGGRMPSKGSQWSHHVGDGTLAASRQTYLRLETTHGLREPRCATTQYEASGWQEAQATLRGIESERQRYASELVRLEREMHQQKQSCHAQLQHRNDYLAQQVTEIEAQHQHSNARYAELEEKVAGLVRQLVQQELRLREADNLYRVIDSALMYADIRDVEGMWTSDFGKSSQFHVSKRRRLSALATKEDLVEAAARIHNHGSMPLVRQPESKENQI
ncbi:hypothetical protein MPH_06567 [Macrophomina phaseolina MS6]|uniref:Uncharacterized protein n=1 Tax=Macrophomina phaseolina (strain MS6) TaxID=1126212 RepID=K2S167_MACPH|nr:hypothetical protein MPH_06567 [Macrophomina phaseolina MS6]